ncbi:mandelate racemase/muconate lactonizing enzyme family protein [Rhodoflexus caldus]|uniref:mandelate racemase/muconate lactonizing enzyme family protein n=1 Tax=Rhodoflexus caldus TaxID=2891236 RepID=UPI00202A6A65|nr:dipeptide epimerase [Rhodoflexus caldus]
MSLITKIEIFRLQVPLKYPFVISLGTIRDADNIIVKIHTDDGLFGTGEGCPYVYIVGETAQSAFANAQAMANLWLGKDASAIENRIVELKKIFPFNYTLRSAFDMALYDWLGKKCQQPLYKLLGGANDRTLSTDMTVGIASPEEMAATALKFKQEGFPAIKLKLGTGVAEDVARVRAVREVIGYDIPIRIDANQGWNATTAVQTLQQLAAFQIQFCEEPISRGQVHYLPHVRQNSPIPIMADESLFDSHDAFRLAAADACDYFNIKLSKSGGIYEALRIVAIADAAGKQSQIGCMSETRLALTAFAHLALARKNIQFFDMDSVYMLAADPVQGGIQFHAGGKITVPDAAGLGAEIAPEWLAGCAEQVVVR